MIDGLYSMIQSFNGLHLTADKAEQTFMQLTGYPHLENVCSNVLAFFFDTEETHNFGRLFIMSLLECVGKQTNCRSTETVVREMSTDKGNRIDIFIETDKHIIAIENKVFSGLNNPLADYEAHIHKLNGANEKEPIFILLTLREENPGESAFINVTFSKLFAAIRKNLGTYVVTASTKWIVLLNDFIRTMDELQGGAILNKELIEFYNENETAIDALLEAKKDMSILFKSKLQAIMNMASVPSHLLEGKYSASSDDCSAEYYLTHTNIEQIGAPVHCLIYMNTKYYNILIGIDGATDSQKNMLQKLLQDRKLKVSHWEDNANYFLVKKFGIFEADEVVVQGIENMLSCIV